MASVTKNSKSEKILMKYPVDDFDVLWQNTQVSHIRPIWAFCFLTGIRIVLLLESCDHNIGRHLCIFSMEYTV